METPAFEYRAISLFPYAEVQHRRPVCAPTRLFPYALLQVTKDRIDWAAKNRLNWVHPCINEIGPKLWEKVRSREEIVPEIVKRGLGLHYGGHSYFAWLPPDKYFASHPDYYAAIQDGKPHSLNLANPEVAKADGGQHRRVPQCKPGDLHRDGMDERRTGGLHDAGLPRDGGTPAAEHQQLSRQLSADDQLLERRPHICQRGRRDGYARRIPT